MGENISRSSKAQARILKNKVGACPKPADAGRAGSLWNPRNTPTCLHRSPAPLLRICPLADSFITHLPTVSWAALGRGGPLENSLEGK